MVPAKSFFKWLRKVGVIERNPAADFEMPREEKRLPKAILSEEEARGILASCTPSTASGLRDRALLETLCSTGIRRAEVAVLGIRDVDAARGLVSVRQGKAARIEWSRSAKTPPLGSRNT